NASIPVSMFFTAAIADLMTYVVTAIELTVCYHSSGYVSAFVDFMTTYAVTQIPLSIIEGILFAMFAKYLLNSRPEVFKIAEDRQNVGLKKSGKEESA
ncbi:MAG: energy-coupling factor ABC transporter permease, partial [Sphaerochaetaceae bacterium]